ncbi:hypothetical protein EYR40_007526 [Pleurotus pulmonarius]|nr:hypothetical protein EYR38_008175 [Pleurotus pulmonarius]KAF4597076.1 hypothetical protein EYR40_007526 [Pleurotus pulmonarius]
MVQFSVLNFIKSQWTPVPSAPKVDLDGQTVVVVGANTGIGFEAAMHFAKMGPGRLILACRSLSRGSAALDKLKATTGCETAELWLLDLSSFESVRAFADRIELEVQRLDILIANAAVVPNQFEETEDHWETSIQVNHIAPALLIILLMPKMFASLDESTKSPRIVIVSSSLHHHAKVPDNVFKSSTPLQVLSDKSLSSPFVTTVAVNPGFCCSDLRRETRTLVIWALERVLAFTAEEGSRQIVWAALNSGAVPEEKVDCMKGAFVSYMSVEKPSDFVLSDEGAMFRKKLWCETLEIVAKLDPRIKPICDKYFV